MKSTHIAAAAVLAFAAASCSVPGGWSVDGVVNDAPEGTAMALEQYSNGRWLLLDSVRTNSNGAFGYDSKTGLSGQEIMRLNLPGKGTLAFPVDSAEAITIETNYNTFGLARIAGSPAAADFARVDSIIAAGGSDMKDKLVDVIMADTSCITSYYILSKTQGRRMLFSPDNDFDNRIYGAAAQKYMVYRPGDARGEGLKQAYYAGRVAMGRVSTNQDSTTTVEIPASGYIDVDLYDYRGTQHKLSEVAVQGKVVLLSFTSYELEVSPAYNALLNTLYERYHNRGLEIYQIAFDSNEADWKTAAANLPWITVWNSPADGDVNLRNYNVGAIPTTYIIDRTASIADRIDDNSQLTNAVAKYF